MMTRMFHRVDEFHGGASAAVASSSVAGVAVGPDEDPDVPHGSGEAVEAFLFVVEQGVGGDDDLPPAVPDAAADEAVVGELGREAAEQDGRVGHGPEGLVLAQDPRLFAQGAVGVEELGVVERSGPEVEGQRKRLVFDEPCAFEVLRRPAAGRSM